jgi:hypothetical protein
MILKNKTWQHFLGDRLSLLLFLLVTIGCTNQTSSKLAQTKSDTSTKDTITQESSSRKNPS